MVDLILVLCGLGLLVGGGESLVRGATRLAMLARVPPAVVGLTVVALGTSLPELVVSVRAALRGVPDVAVGNVIGSNTFNVLLVLGLAALLRPLRIAGSTVRLEWPVMVLATLAVYVLGFDGQLGRLDGGFLFVGLVVFLAWTVRLALADATPVERAELTSTLVGTPGAGRVAWLVASAAVLGGLALLAGGAELLVTGAVGIAEHMGIPDRIIGLTVVAIGTSLPELFASAIASLRGRDDVAVANVVGSNIFNVLGILGTTALITPVPISDVILASDVWWMVGSSLVLLPLMWPGFRIQRGKGALLLLAAAVYLGVLGWSLV